MAESRDQQKAAILQHLSSKGIHPTASWLSSFMSSARVGVPLVSLQQTALFQILASDLTTAAQPTSIFPPHLSDPNRVEHSYTGPVLAQVTDIEDIGSSLWSQVEAIEAHERGETTRGREVIRVLPAEQTDSTDTRSQPRTNGPYKLCLQDAKDTKLYALVLSNIDKLSTSTPIGSKLIIRDLKIARGVILLEARNVQFLGGKVDVWDREWKAKRKQRLMDRARATTGP